MSTSAQRTRSGCAQLKSSRGISRRSLNLLARSIVTQPGGGPMFRSILTSALSSALLALALGASGALAQGTIKIAILGPMAFVQGDHHWNGAEMARDEINKAGGINVGGKKMLIELVRGDTNELQSVPDATNAAERVITREKV